MVSGLAILILGGNFLLKSGINIANRAKISPLVAGVTVVAFGTSAPELLISVQAALIGSSDFTMGNVIGSNICNLALIFGVTLLINPVKINTDSIKIDWPVAMLASILLYILILRGAVSVYEGIVLLCLLVVYTLFIVLKSRKEWESNHPGEEDENTSFKKGIWYDLLLLAMGSAALYFGSEWLVLGAKSTGERFAISERVMGIMFLALGTSLPELITSLLAAFKKQTDLAIGNLIGSNIFNILFILGLTSMITEINVNPKMISVDIIWMIGITLIILPLMAFKKRMGRASGLLLLTLYFIYSFVVIA